MAPVQKMTWRGAVVFMSCLFFFFFNDPATTEIYTAQYTLSLHDALPIWYEHHVISGNYRLGEFQGAVLNGQLDRLEPQTATRDANGARLARRLQSLPGLFPQRRPPECTRHAYHLFMVRLDPAAFGASRDAVTAALEAEGIPCSAGYGFSLSA